MMMNGELVKDAVSVKPGSRLGDLLSENGIDPQKVKRLFLMALGRQPTKTELNRAQQYLKESRDQLAVYQDMFWALLNSNEFIFNH